MRHVAIVLAGGQSRRMGTNKLLLQRNQHGDATILQHVVDCARAVAEEVYVSHAPTLTPELSRQIPKDEHIHLQADRDWHQGPLRALANLQAQLVLDTLVYVVAGDLPGVQPVVLETCATVLCNTVGADAALVVRGGRLQPLLGCYRAAALDAYVAADLVGETRLMAVMEQLSVVTIQPERLGWPEWWTKPVHTPADYLCWQTDWGR